MWNKKAKSLQNSPKKIGPDSSGTIAVLRCTECALAFSRREKPIEKLLCAGKIIYQIENGAGTSIPGHSSTDLKKDPHMHIQVFAYPELITAFSNSISCNHIFVKPLSRRPAPDDIPVIISSSGHFPNMLNNCRSASETGDNRYMDNINSDLREPSNPGSHVNFI